MSRGMTYNKTSTLKWPWLEFYGEKSLKNGKFFNFADFHFKTHVQGVPPFFLQTIETVTFIAVNICSSI